MPPPDLFVYLYAMIDLLAEGPERDEVLQKVSVNGFLQSRPYMTDIAADLQRHRFFAAHGDILDQEIDFGIVSRKLINRK